MTIIITTIILILLAAPTDAGFCTQPQRAGMFSFQALSGRDHLTNVFSEVNKNINSYNVSLKLNGSDYSILNFKPQFYYNDNDQNQSYVDSFSVNVTSGKLFMGYNFDYRYGQVSLKTGNAFGKVLLDPFNFLKKTDIVDGYFQWDPTNITDITISLLMTIQSSTPKLQDDAKTIFQYILNNHAGEQNKLRSSVFNDLNNLYKQNLKKYLNSQNLINANNVQYQWKGNIVNYTNQIYYFSMSNTSYQGLKYFFLFQLEEYMDKCNILPVQFDVNFGGVQQIVGLQFMKAGVLYGLKKGWFNTKLGPQWQTQVFQFYMGDLANCMAQALNFIPNTPITGECHWNNSQYNLQMSYYNTKSIFFNIPYTCTLNVNNNTLLQTISFNAVFIVDLILTNSYIDTNINYMGVLDPKFFPSGNYVVNDEGLGVFYMTKVIKTLQGKRTYGAGFPTLYRKFPILRIMRDYIIMYDPSQV